MKTKTKHLLGAVLPLLAIFVSSIIATAQTDTRLVYSADVTDRKTHVTSHQIFVMNADGSAVTQETIGGGAFPAWSRNKNYILFHRSTSVENTIYIMETLGERNGGRIFPAVSGGGDTGVDWAPDDGMIVFSGTAGIQDGLWIMAVNPDSQELGTPTLVRAGLAAAPAWSPDGKRIAFVSYPGAIGKVLDLETGIETDVGGLNAYAYAPSFSPNGQQIAYMAAGPVTTTSKGKTTTTWHAEIFIVNLDGTGRRQVTTLLDYNNFPKWSYDGTQIAFQNELNGGNAIYKVTLATGAVTLLNKTGETFDW